MMMIIVMLIMMIDVIDKIYFLSLFIINIFIMMIIKEFEYFEK